MFHRIPMFLVSIALTIALWGCKTTSSERADLSPPNPPMSPVAKPDVPDVTPDPDQNRNGEWTPIQKGPYTFYRECPDCHGKGFVCKLCNGTGKWEQFVGDVMGGGGTIALPCPNCIKGVKVCLTCNAKHYELHPEDFLSEEEKQAYVAKLYRDHQDAEADYVQKMEHISRDEAQARQEEADRQAQTYHNSY